MPAHFYLLVFPPQRGAAVWTKDVFCFSCPLQTGELLTLLAPYMAAPFSHAFNGSFDVSCSCLAFPDMNVVFKLRWVYNLLPHL